MQIFSYDVLRVYTVATVPETGNVLVSFNRKMKHGDTYRISHLTFEGFDFINPRTVHSAIASRIPRLLAVVGPLSGGRCYLITGCLGSPYVRVITEPVASESEAHTIWEDPIPSIECGITGIVADPNGKVIVICCIDCTVRVVLWPWAGLEL